MTLDFAESIRKMMGWCPQKWMDFADANRVKHGLFSDKFQLKDSHAGKGITAGEKLIIIYQDINLTSNVIIAGFLLLIVMVIFFIIALFLPIFRNFVYIISFVVTSTLSFLALYLSSKNNGELTADSIIINRPFQKVIVIPKDNILKSEVVKNYNHLFWWILPISVIIMSAFFMKNIIDVSTRYFVGNDSLSDTISIILSYIGIMSMYVSIYFMGKKTAPYRSALKITAKLKKEVSLHVYVDDPQELKNKLEVSL